MHGFLHRAQSGIASGHSGLQGLRSGFGASRCVLGQVLDQGLHGSLGLAHLAFHHLTDLATGALGDVKQLSVVSSGFLGQRLEHLCLQRHQLLCVTHRHQGFGLVLGIAQSGFGGAHVELDELLHTGESFAGQASEGFQIGLVGGQHLIRGQGHVLLH